MKKTAIQKWGNSFAVRLPKDTIDRLGLIEGQSVQVEATKDGKGIVILPLPSAEYSLETLLTKVTAQNKHTEDAWGVPMGNEVW